MRIGIEAQRIFRANKHGMDYVVLQEILHLQQMDHENEYFVFVKPGPDRCVEDSDNVHVIELSMPSYPLWEQVALPRAARRYAVDMLHCTSNTAPIFCRLPLITVSEFEKQNIISKLHIPEKCMAMIYNGYNAWFKELEDINEVYKNYISKPGYIFFLGNTDPKKNTERTLVAYARYLERSTVKRPLLMADLDHDYLDGIIERNHIGHIREHLFMPGYIPNADLTYIYNKAFAFLYTSLRESFGIPLLEAMACGTPVVTSNTSSMPEIGGKDAILVDPENADEIAQKLLQLETDDLFWEEQHKMGLKRAALFSWQRTAEELLHLYEDVWKELK